MPQVCEAFAALMEYVVSLGVRPPPDDEECLERQVDKRWHVAMNRRNRTAKNLDGLEVPPFTCAVKYNGWPAGLFGPAGGIIAAGECANEATFISALRSATKPYNKHSTER